MPVAKHLPSRKSFSSFLSLFVYAGPTWIDYVLLGVGLLAAASAGVPFPLMGILFGQLVDDLNGATCSAEASVNADDYQAAINDKVLILVYIAIASFVFIYVYIICWNLLGQRLAQRLREQYFRSLLRQDASFFDNIQAGEVSSRLNGDIQTIQSGTSEKVGIFISSSSFFITAYVIAFIKDAQLAGMLVSLVPAFLIMSLVGGKYVQKYATSMSDCIAAASSIASEGLSHVAIVHSLGANDRLESKFAGHLMRAQKEGIKKALAAAVQAGLLYFIAYSANALAYWQGSKKIAREVAGEGDGKSVGEIYTVIFILVDGEPALTARHTCTLC